MLIVDGSSVDNSLFRTESTLLDILFSSVDELERGVTHLKRSQLFFGATQVSRVLRRSPSNFRGYSLLGDLVVVGSTVAGVGE